MSKLLLLLSVVLNAALATNTCSKCGASVTRVSGTHAPSQICSGDIIFQEEFNSLNFKKWQHENTLAGGRVREFYRKWRRRRFECDLLTELRVPVVHQQPLQQLRSRWCFVHQAYIDSRHHQ